MSLASFCQSRAVWWCQRHDINFCICCWFWKIFCFYNFRPGFARLNIPFFMSEEERSFVVEALALVAEHGWKLLPQVQWDWDVEMSCYRAFSHDVMLSSNIAASIATEINIHLCKHHFTSLCVTVSQWTLSIRGSSAWWLCARMVRVTALDIHVSLRNLPPMLENSMTSVKMLYIGLDTYLTPDHGGMDLESQIMHCTVRALVFSRNQNLAPQSITKKPMEVYWLDQWYVITPYVAGLLHPAIF